MLRGGLAGQSLLVDADEFAEAEPVILRYRLNAPLVLGGGLALGGYIVRVANVTSAWSDDQLVANAGSGQHLSVFTNC